MFPVTNKDYSASVSGQLDVDENEGNTDGKKGSKPSLAERNRERQQRFRQRQKSRIEELEARCHRLTAQGRTLAAEKDELAKNVALLKNLVSVRDLQLVAVTSQLTQYLPGNGDVKLDLPSLEDVGGVEALLQQPATARVDPDTLNLTQLQAEAAHSQQRPQQLEGPSSADTDSQVPLRAGSPASAGRAPPRPHSPQLALDQLCRVAEMAELQRGESSSPAGSSKPERRGDQAGVTSGSPPSILSHLSSGFERLADVFLVVEGQRLLVHSALLAARSEFFARKFEELQHSQPLFPLSQEPKVVDLGAPGKRIQDVLLFLRHCYGVLDLGPVEDADIMRLVVLSDELEAKSLLQLCDEAIIERAEGKQFSYFVDLSQGGDVVDWIRLADRLGLKKVSGACEMHLARYLKENRTWRENTRLNELGQECLLRVINKLAGL